MGDWDFFYWWWWKPIIDPILGLLWLAFFILMGVLLYSFVASRTKMEDYRNLAKTAEEVGFDNIMAFPLIGEGSVNESFIKRMGFYGAALNGSRLIKDGILMVNDATAGWASTGFDFADATDLSDFSLNFFIK